MTRTPAFLFLLLLISCSSPRTDQDRQNIPVDTPLTSLAPPPAPPDTASCPSAGYRNFVKDAAKAGFAPKDTAVFHKSAQKDFFGLVKVSNTFSSLETSILARSKNACLELEKKINGRPVQFGVEEWTFAGTSEAQLIENALTAPLRNKTDVRFVSSPFTFWRVNQRMYFVHTPAESARTEMNTLNDLLVNNVAPH